jgi:hypothetical protein
MGRIFLATLLFSIAVLLSGCPVFTRGGEGGDAPALEE